MKNWTNEAEAREKIKGLVAEYYHDFKEPEQKKEFKTVYRLYYSNSVYD